MRFDKRALKTNLKKRLKEFEIETSRYDDTIYVYIIKDNFKLTFAICRDKQNRFDLFLTWRKLGISTPTAIEYSIENIQSVVDKIILLVPLYEEKENRLLKLLDSFRSYTDNEKALVEVNIYNQGLLVEFKAEHKELTYTITCNVRDSVYNAKVGTYLQRIYLPEDFQKVKNWNKKIKEEKERFIHEVFAHE